MNPIPCLAWRPRNAVIIFLSSFLLLVAVPGVSESLTPAQVREGTDIRTRVFPPLRKIDLAAVQALTNAERSLLVAYLQASIEDTRSAGDSNFRLDGCPEAFELALLGEDVGRSIIARYYLADPNSGTAQIRRLNDPKMIPLIGKALFKEDPPDSPYGNSPGQGVALLDILHLLQLTHVFSQGMIDWAKSLAGSNSGFREKLTTMRLWYRANEAALKSSNFAGVLPGKILVEAASGGANSMPLGMKEQVPESNLIATGCGLPDKSRGARWLTAGISLATVIAIVFWSCRRIRSDRE